MVPLMPTASRREPVQARWERSEKVVVRVDQVRAVGEVRMIPPRLLPEQFPLADSPEMARHNYREQADLRRHAGRVSLQDAVCPHPASHAGQFLASP